MKINKTGILMAASFAALLAQLNGQVTLDSRSITASNSISADYENLNAALVETLDNALMRPLDNTNQILTAAADMGVGETFSLTVSGASNYTWGAATFTAAGVTIDGGNSGFGVFGGARSDRIDAAGEAVLVTFNLGGLTSPHQDSFVLQGLAMGRWADTSDFYNYAVYDSSGDLKHVGAEDQGASSLSGLSLNIANGDVLVVGWDGVAATSEFTFDTLTVDIIPEPSAYALLGGLVALGSVLLRRRRC